VGTHLGRASVLRVALQSRRQSIPTPARGNQKIFLGIQTFRFGKVGILKHLSTKMLLPEICPN